LFISLISVCTILQQPIHQESKIHQTNTTDSNECTWWYSSVVTF